MDDCIGIIVIHVDDTEINRNFLILSVQFLDSITPFSSRQVAGQNRPY